MIKTNKIYLFIIITLQNKPHSNPCNFMFVAAARNRQYDKGTAAVIRIINQVNRSTK